MTNSTLNPIEQIAKLTAQRTVRTNQLHAAVRTLTDALESAGARPGESSVTVDDWTLGYYCVRSNIGSRDCWSWTKRAGVDGYSEDGCTDLGFELNHDGYLHGDFGQPVTGPTRAHLIAFGARARRLVEALVDKLSASCEALDKATEQVDAATEKL
jgi:hypothetical protein